MLQIKLPTSSTQDPVIAANALLAFDIPYRDSKTGDIPWKQFPEALQSAQVAKIPSIHDVEK